MHEQERKRQWMSRLCGCMRGDATKTKYNNYSDVTNKVTAIVAITDIDINIELHPLILVNGTINTSDSNTIYADKIINAMIQDRVSLLLHHYRINTNTDIIIGQCISAIKKCLLKTSNCSFVFIWREFQYKYK